MPPKVIESLNTAKRAPAQKHHSIRDMDHYNELYRESIDKPEQFFSRLARELLSWETDFKTVRKGGFEKGDVAWFVEGRLNASYNAVDRHALANPDKVAIIYEADEPGQGHKVTYGQLLKDVCRIANVLKSFGVKKGDTVAVYLPMIPEAVVTLLAIVRIGAIHSVVFAGFSAQALRDRILDAGCKVIITTDQSVRGGRVIETKKIVDEALKYCPDVRHTLVYKRTGRKGISWNAARDHWWHEEVEKQKPQCTPVPVNAEDPLFLLYTSGSTGTPKGVVHATGGYLFGAACTTKYVFDVQPDDIIFTAGDVGWITGHTYLMYGPLLLGSTTVVFESTPAYPDFSRLWDIVQTHKVTHFYVAPTALKLLKRAGIDWIHHDLSSIRILGSVGEPITPDLWVWYDEHVGKGKAQICDTYWQTETGSHIISPIAGVTHTKPGSASFPVFGIDPVLIDVVTGKEIKGNDVEGVLGIRSPWPSMARSVWKSHNRYMNTYLRQYPGFYFTGDGAARDSEGYYWIRGRVDDIVNVSGHRLSTAEIEAALIEHPYVSECAVVGMPDELTGQSVVAFVMLKNKLEDDKTIKAELVHQVRQSIGPFSAPRIVFLVNDLPKTRSGKILRRILRKVLVGKKEYGDTSTIANPESIEKLENAVKIAVKS